MTHHCLLPALAVDDDHEDVCCHECGQWWTPVEDYCHECGRSDGYEWKRTSGPTYGPPLADGEHWAKPPPSALLSLTFPMVTVRRGGITFDGPPPPRPSWLERDADIKAAYTRTIKANSVTGIAFDEGASMAGGWCAPSEVFYEN